MAMLGNERCDGCIFWKSLGEYGLCRKKAPIAYADYEHSNCTAWPETACNDFCGEFEPKKPAKEGKKK